MAPKIFVYSGSGEILKPNHLVTGILHNDKKLIVDPTMRLNFLGAEGIYLFNDAFKKEKTAVSLSDKEIRLASCWDIDNNDNMKMRREFMKYDSLTDEEEILSYYNFVQGNLARHIVDFGMFHMDERPKILQLAKLNEKFSPHGKIKKY